MLGVCLLYVGIVLINNGICTLYKVEGKAAAVMNIFTGGLSLFINFVNLVQGNYYAAGTGLLFCFTYLFVAVIKIFNLNGMPFAWFSTFVAVNAVIFGTLEGFIGIPCLESLRISAGRVSGICGQFCGELLLWRKSWGKNWENLFHFYRFLKVLSRRGFREF